MRQDIYMHKGVPDDSTPLSAESPTESNSAGSPTINVQSTVFLGYAAMAGRQMYRTAVDEMKATGNEELAMKVSNAANFVTQTALVIGTGGKALIPMGINAVVETVGSTMQRNRENREIEIENRLRGRVLRGGIND